MNRYDKIRNFEMLRHSQRLRQMGVTFKKLAEALNTMYM
jgi:hypothetical protein